jgi:hypothetical protein
MSARVARLAGAIVASDGDRWFLVGNPKGPLDLEAHGFAALHEPIDAMARPWIALEPRRPITLAPPIVSIDLAGDALPITLARRFLITRNGSVSDRLWRLVVSPDPLDPDAEPPDAVDARWLGAMPDHVWDVVRDAVLRCS